MIQWSVRIFGAAALAIAFHATAMAEADVILGELVGPRVYARDGGIAAISVGTTSCNAGDKVLAWNQLPDNKHPVISLNMYRLLNGRLIQIGQSWAKHGFVALQQNVCNFGCKPNPGGGSGLGIGCSDPYGVGNNMGPDLGSRSLINPVTGFFDGLIAANALGAFQSTSPIDHGLQVNESDLALPGARYFLEGHYIAADDAMAGNGGNNVSHGEVKVTRDGTGELVIELIGATGRPTQRELPAIRAWPYADFAEYDSGLEDGKVIVAYTVVRISRTAFRYEYAVYNLNSERAVNSFSIPIKLPVTNIGMSSVLSHGEVWSNDPWPSKIENGRLIWATKTFQESPNANAIRWGTSFNFWFETESPPVPADAQLRRFKPGAGPDAFALRVKVPK